MVVLKCKQSWWNLIKPFTQTRVNQLPFPVFSVYGNWRKRNQTIKSLLPAIDCLRVLFRVSTETETMGKCQSLSGGWSHQRPLAGAASFYEFTSVTEKHLKSAKYCIRCNILLYLSLHSPVFKPLPVLYKRRPYTSITNPRISASPGSQHILCKTKSSASCRTY